MFEPFKKIPRLVRDMVVTEKIDGTNAQIHIVNIASNVSTGESRAWLDFHSLAVNGDLVMLAASRSKYLSLGRDGAKDGDNFGFAKWVRENADELWKLGEGRHFGEWWGLGVQRTYGMTEKRFSLFNTSAWASPMNRNDPRETSEVDRTRCFQVPCCHVVPVLARYTFCTTKIQECVERLSREGSVAAPGFMKPEGVVVFHAAAGQLFKQTIDKDAEPKSNAAA